MPPQPGDLGVESSQPTPRLLAQLCLARIGDGIEQAHHLAWIRLGDGPFQLLRQRPGDLPFSATSQFARPCTERLKIAQAEGPARAGQERGDIRVGGDVIDYPQRRHDRSDLRQPQQPTQANDLDGDLQSPKGFEQGQHGGVAAHEDGVVGPPHPCLVLHDDALGDPADLIGERVEESRYDVALCRILRRHERHACLSRGCPKG